MTAGTGEIGSSLEQRQTTPRTAEVRRPQGWKKYDPKDGEVRLQGWRRYDSKDGGGTTPRTGGGTTPRMEDVESRREQRSRIGSGTAIDDSTDGGDRIASGTAIESSNSRLFQPRSGIGPLQ